MNNFPLSKYQFYINGNKVIAVSSYEGRRVRGVAKCNPIDEFDLEKGKRLAAARCNAKVAERRLKRANNELLNLYTTRSEINHRIIKGITYCEDASMKLREAQEDLELLLETL